MGHLVIGLIFPDVDLASRMRDALDRALVYPRPGRTVDDQPSDVWTQHAAALVEHPSGDGRAAICVSPDDLWQLAAILRAARDAVAAGTATPVQQKFAKLANVARLSVDWTPHPQHPLAGPESQLDPVE